MGKSRLVAEFLGSLDVRAVRGRCLPYGEGITYWPVVEVLKQLDALPSDPAAAASIRSLLRESDDATSAEEIAWAFRKLLEEQAPLVVLVDDIQWGEERLLDLIEGAVLLSSGASLLILCAARPELLERRPSWPVSIRLAPLPEEAVEELIGDQVTGELRDRIAAAAGGNPLFVTEMLAMTGESGDVEVPPTLRALLSARLDQLDSAERRVLECGAVEGEVFHRGGVQALAPEELHVSPRLAALVRRELIRSDKAAVPGDDGFRFRHLLIRDAAYDGLAKAKRAGLHELLADWIDSREPALIEADEVIGYHLETAHGYLVELGLNDEHAAKVKDRARGLLASAGRRALNRGDAGAAANLLGRALALHDADDPAVTLRLELADALFISGRGPQGATAASEAAEIAKSVGDEPGAVRASLRAGRLTIDRDPDPKARAQLRALVEEGLEMFGSVEDDRGLTQAYWAAAELEAWDGHFAAAFAALERAKEYAHRAGDTHRERLIWIPMATALSVGPTPVDEVLNWLDAQGVDAERWEPVLGASRAVLLAMLGRAEDARAVCASAVARMAELGQYPHAAGPGWEVERLAGDYVAAESAARRQWELNTTAGFPIFWAAFEVAESLYQQGRYAESEAAFSLGSDIARDSVDVMFIHKLRAKLLARKGEHDRARQLAEEAVSIAERTDMLDAHAEALSDLAEVLELAGSPDQAAQSLAGALVLYEHKGNIAMVQRTRTRLCQGRIASRSTKPT